MAGTMEATPQGSTPVPDPTKLTQEAVERSEKSIHEWVDGQLAVRDERLRGMDTATALRLTVLDHISGQMDEKVAAAVDLTNEKFAGVTQQFAERDIRTEREATLVATARDAAFKAQQEAVAAAFAAQEKQAGAQNKANAEAAAKSEAAIADSISKLTQLFQTSNSALADKIDDLKERVGRVESVKVGQVEQRNEGRQSTAAVYGTIAAFTGLVVFVIVIAAVLIEANK